MSRSRLLAQARKLYQQAKQGRIKPSTAYERVRRLADRAKGKTKRRIIGILAAIKRWLMR